MNLLSKFIVSTALLCAFSCLPGRADADPVRAQWPQPAAIGTDVFITYSYAGLQDWSYRLLSDAELRGATEEAFRLWAAVAPLHFIEQPDSGPPPSDASYEAAGHPMIRIGHHEMFDLAHAYDPGTDGLAGDVHFNSGIPWSVGEGHWNFLEALTHELGHALGLEHELSRPAIMNPSYPQRRFFGLGTAFLLPADVQNVRAIYGAGRGSVQPLSHVPEPAGLILVATGLFGLARAFRRR